jgi:hypothetical protein
MILLHDVTVPWVLVKMGLLGITFYWLQVNKIGSLTPVTFVLSFQYHHHLHLGSYSCFPTPLCHCRLTHSICCMICVVCIFTMTLPTNRHLCIKSVVPAFWSLCFWHLVSVCVVTGYGNQTVNAEDCCSKAVHPISERYPTQDLYQSDYTFYYMEKKWIILCGYVYKRT